MLSLDRSSSLAKHFAPHQIAWIEAEDPFHAQGRQVCALAEKSIRIGWTYADAFKNVRKRLRFKKRDYLFATKDYPSALEYMRQAWEFAELFDLTRTIISHGEEFLKIPRLDDRGRASGFTEEIKVGVIKFDTASRIIAFSSNPQAMAVYGGDVGLDEFAKHPNARLLWETAQGRVSLANDIAVWSAHDGEDTLFYQFCLQARSSVVSPSPAQPAQKDSLPSSSFSYSSPFSRSSSTPPEPPPMLPAPARPPPPSSTYPPIHQSTNPWNLYFRVTMPDAIHLGFLDILNKARGTRLQPEQFLADCRARAGLDEIFQQSYLCNPVPPAAAIADWSAIERCRHDYEIERLHLDHDQIVREFGAPSPSTQLVREQRIRSFLHSRFSHLFNHSSSSPSDTSSSDLSDTSPPVKNHKPKFQNPLAVPSFQPGACNLPLRLGFDVASSGRGNLAAIYLDAARGSELWLAALFTCRTDDWHFLKTVLFILLRDLSRIQGAGDESGLGRQICWEAANHFGHHKFAPVNFSAKKSDLGFLLMNQLAAAQKRFPQSHPDIAADFFALRKHFTGSRWLFTEGRNPFNNASHCDIAWAAALASDAHARKRSNAWALVG